MTMMAILKNVVLRLGFEWSSPGARHPIAKKPWHL